MAEWKPSGYWDRWFQKLSGYAAGKWRMMNIREPDEDSEDVGRDVAAQAILQFWRAKCRGVANPDFPYAYLKKIAKNILLKKAEKVQRRRKVLVREYSLAMVANYAAQESRVPLPDQDKSTFYTADIEPLFAYMKRRTAGDLLSWKVFLLLAIEYKPREIAAELGTTPEVVHELGRKTRQFVENFHRYGTLAPTLGYKTAREKLYTLAVNYLIGDLIDTEDFLETQEDILLGSMVIGQIQPLTGCDLLDIPMYPTIGTLIDDEVPMERWENYELRIDEQFDYFDLPEQEKKEIRERVDIVAMLQVCDALMPPSVGASELFFAIAQLKASIETVALERAYQWVRFKSSPFTLRAAPEGALPDGYENVAEEKEKALLERYRYTLWARLEARKEEAKAILRELKDSFLRNRSGYKKV